MAGTWSDRFMNDGIDKQPLEALRGVAGSYLEVLDGFEQELSDLVGHAESEDGRIRVA